jgi:hypothetical protein
MMDVIFDAKVLRILEIATSIVIMYSWQGLSTMD